MPEGLGYTIFITNCKIALKSVLGRVNGIGILRGWGLKNELLQACVFTVVIQRWNEFQIFGSNEGFLAAWVCGHPTPRIPYVQRSIGVRVRE